MLTEPIDIVPLSPAPGEEFWEPFGSGPDAHAGFDPGWWHPLGSTDVAENRFFVLRDGDGRQVARLKLEWAFPAGVYPTADAAASRPMLEVEFIEVRHDSRTAGLGTRFVRLIQAAFPDRQLVALSEADGFWASLGWSRHLHCEDDGSTQHYRAMYLAP